MGHSLSAARVTMYYFAWFKYAELAKILFLIGLCFQNNFDYFTFKISSDSP